MTDSSKFIDFGIVLWLIPDKHHTSKFQALIQDFSHRFQGPIFRPHLTLLTHIPIEFEANFNDSDFRNSMTAIFNSLGPINITFSGLGSNPNYYQACFLQAEINSELIKLRTDLNSFFSISSNHTFNPHLSLFYGALTSFQLAEAAHLTRFSRPFSVPFDSVEVYKIQGDTSSWERIDSIALSSTFRI